MFRSTRVFFLPVINFCHFVLICLQFFSFLMPLHPNIYNRQRRLWHIPGTARAQLAEVVHLVGSGLDCEPLPYAGVSHAGKESSIVNHFPMQVRHKVWPVLERVLHKSTQAMLGWRACSLYRMSEPIVCERSKLARTFY